MVLYNLCIHHKDDTKNISKEKKMYNFSYESFDDNYVLLKISEESKIGVVYKILKDFISGDPLEHVVEMRREDGSLLFKIKKEVCRL